MATYDSFVSAHVEPPKVDQCEGCGEMFDLDAKGITIFSSKGGVIYLHKYCARELASKIVREVTR